jgi:acetyltransferase-like isoleucine patch superfamily enzyme
MIVSTVRIAEYMSIDLPSTETRKARCNTYASLGDRTSLWYYPRVTGGTLRVLWNAICIYMARYAPSFQIKRMLYIAVGAHIGIHAAIGLGVTFDVFFPQEITIDDDVIVGYNTIILAHEFMRHEWRRGPVHICQDATIGANCTLLPGVVVGAGSTVSAMSLVNRDVPPGAFVGGVPIRSLARE